MDLLPAADLRKLVTRAISHGAPERVATRDAATWVPGLERDVAKLGKTAATSVPPRRVMITYLSTGNGHRTAAEAVYGRLSQMYPGWQIDRPVDVANLSLMARMSTFVFNKAVAWGLWPTMFRLADRFSGTAHMGWLRRKLDLLGAGKFLERVKAQNPDVIVHTNFLGSEIQSAARASGKIAPEVENVQVVTDMVGYGMYLGAHADLTLAPNREVVRELEQKGMDASKIAITGIPINPAFAKPVDRAAARAAMGLGKDAKVLLVQGNLIEDAGYYRQLLERLATEFPNGAGGRPIEVAVVCGKDAKLYADLQALARQYPGKVTLKPLGFMSPDQMHDAMGASDLSLTKPGGLTTSESVATGLPMVLVDVLGGGQETRNAEFFAKRGAGVTAHDFGSAIDQTVQLLQAPDRLAAMHSAAERVATPDAATKVGRVIAGLPITRQP